MIRHAAALLAMMLIGSAHAQSLEGDARAEDTVTAPELAVESVGYEETIEISWTAPTDVTVSWYYVYRTRDGVESQVARIAGGTTSYLAEGHQSGDTYTVQAAAFGPVSALALPWC